MKEITLEIAKEWIEEYRQAVVEYLNKEKEEGEGNPTMRNVILLEPKMELLQKKYDPPSSRGAFSKGDDNWTTATENFVRLEGAVELAAWQEAD